jgi:hypothetical protein
MRDPTLGWELSMFLKVINLTEMASQVAPQRQTFTEYLSMKMTRVTSPVKRIGSRA